METVLTLCGLSPAKINLFLHITGKRPDGYHELYTLFCAVTIYDKIEISPAPRPYIICDKPDIPVDSSNIIMKTDALIRERHPDIPHFKISLYKNIPAGAGLGGGSSNACTYLRLVDKACGLNLSTDEMADILGRVGSDTVFFLHLPAATGRGRGEIITPVGDLPGLNLLIINPMIKISTKDVYSSLKFRLTEQGDPPNMPIQITLRQLAEIMHNDLEQAVFPIYPEIMDLCEQMKKAGALNALMSGSGSTVFGLYGDAASCDSAYRYFRAKYPSFMVEKAANLTAADSKSVLGD